MKRKGVLIWSTEELLEIAVKQKRVHPRVYNKILTSVKPKYSGLAMKVWLAIVK